MVETKQTLLNLEVHSVCKTHSRLLQNYSSNHVFHLKVDYEDYEHICHYQELYEKSYHTIKSVEAIIKSIVFMEVYSKLKPCCRKRDDDL
jgi:hypothetical protein